MLFQCIPIVIVTNIYFQLKYVLERILLKAKRFRDVSSMVG